MSAGNIHGSFMKNLSQELDIIKNEFDDVLKTITTETSLESVRVTFLGRKGKIADLMEQLKNLSVEEKKTVGPLLNQFKLQAQTQLDELTLSLKKTDSAQKNLLEKNFDVSAYKYNELKGTSHIYTQIIADLENTFISIKSDILIPL